MGERPGVAADAGLRSWDAAELDFFEILADTCAQALDRISAQAIAARQSAKLVFLADASTEHAGRYPPDPDAPSGAWNVMRTGRSEWIPEITDDILVASAVDEEQLQLARDLHLRSAVTVPLIARDRVLGVITWVSAESARLFTEEDLSLAEDLAKRAAIAIDYAELHSETLAAAVHLQQHALPDVPGWVVASHYSPSGRTAVGGDFYDAVPLTDGRMALFVGDVMGRGVAAAAAGADARRRRRLHRCRPDATGRDGQPRRHVRAVPHRAAGHAGLRGRGPHARRAGGLQRRPPAALVLRADGSSEQLPSADGAPLAVIPQDRRQVTVPFHVGDTVLAFTDGLIERRDEDIGAGQDRVLGALATLTRQDLSGALDVVVEELRDPDRDDDVAALAARRTA